MPVCTLSRCWRVDMSVCALSRYWRFDMPVCTTCINILPYLGLLFRSSNFDTMRSILVLLPKSVVDGINIMPNPYG